MERDRAQLISVKDNCAELEYNIQNLTEVTEYITQSLEIDVIETDAKNVYRECSFINNDNISNLLKMEIKIGEVEITNEVVELYNGLKEFESFVPKLCGEIIVKTESDLFDCDITGMVLTGTQKLVVTVSANRSVKCIDTKRKHITSQLRVTSSPWDLTKVHRGQLAVTIQSEKIIQFIINTGCLITGRHIRVNGECRGIAYDQYCLIVSFRTPGKIQIIDLQGSVMKTIAQIGLQDKLFEWPDYVAVGKAGSYIYVSDWNRNAVTRLSLKGEVTGVYRDTAGTKIAGVAVASDESVYACKRTIQL